MLPIHADPLTIAEASNTRSLQSHPKARTIAKSLAIRHTSFTLSLFPEHTLRPSAVVQEQEVSSPLCIDCTARWHNVQHTSRSSLLNERSQGVDLLVAYTLQSSRPFRRSVMMEDLPGMKIIFRFPAIDRLPFKASG